MKSNRLFATAALFGVISFAMPCSARAENNLIKGRAQKMSECGEADVKDADLTSRIKIALMIDSITKNAKIHVATANRIVALTGAVPNITIIQEAEKVAQNTEDVKLVLNNLKVENVSNASFEM